MKTESVAEFLARGGQITKVPPKEEVIKEQKLKSSSGGPVNLLTYDEAELYYSESKASKGTKRKAKPQAKLDINALPEALRKKVLEEMSDGPEDEENEDDDGFDSEEDDFEDDYE